MYLVLEIYFKMYNIKCTNTYENEDSKIYFQTLKYSFHNIHYRNTF